MLINIDLTPNLVEKLINDKNRIEGDNIDGRINEILKWYYKDKKQSKESVLDE